MRRNETAEFEIPVRDLKRHTRNGEGILAVQTVLRLDRELRHMEAQATEAKRSALILAFVGAVGLSASLSSPDRESWLIPSSVFLTLSAAFGVVSRMARPSQRPLAQNDLENRLKELDGRQERYNNFYRRHLHQSPATLLDNHGVK